MNEVRNTAKLVVGIIAAAVLAACGPQTTDYTYDTALRQFRTGDYWSARITLLNVIEADSEHLDARQLLVETLLEMGVAQDAHDEYLILRESAGDTVEFQELTAEVMLATRQYDELRSMLQTGKLGMISESARGRFLAEALIGSGNMDAAKYVLDGLQPDASTMAAVQNLRARIAVAQQEPQRALAIAKAVTTDYPDYRPAWMTLGISAALVDEISEARDAFLHLAGMRRASQPQRLIALLTLLDLGVARRDRELMADAANLLTDVVPKSPPEIWARAQIAAFDDDVESAIELAQSVIKLAPGHAPAHRLLGELYTTTGEAGLAEVYLRTATELEPASRSSRIDLVQFHLGQGNDSEAAKILSGLLDTTPEWLRPNVVSALLDAKRGDFERALTLAETLEPLAHKGINADEIQGDVMLTLRRFPDAIAAYELAAEVEFDRELAIKAYYARLWSGAENPETFLEQWLEANDDDHSFRLTLARHLRSQGDYESAARHYRALLDSAPNNPYLLNDLAWSSYKIGDPEALTYAQQAYSVLSGHPAIADTLGWLMLEQGDLEGIPLIERAAAEFPDSRDVRYHLAAARAKQGRTEEALEELRALLADDEQFEGRSGAASLAVRLARASLDE